MVRAPRSMARIALLLAASDMLFSQTTDGLVKGLVRDSITGEPVGGAVVRCESESDPTIVSRPADNDGRFGLPLLPPGRYRIHIEAREYQTADVQNLDLAVAGVLELDLRLRPAADVW